MGYKIIYRHDDGTEFEDEVSMISYQARIDHNINKALFKYQKTENYKSLVNKFSLTEMGIWEIYGEDANAELAGSHIEPLLITVSGSLRAAIRYAVSLPNFTTWGLGGKIKPAKEAKVLND